jgi:hypothetical protein
MAQDAIKDELLVHRLRTYRQALLVVLGVAFTLLVVVLPGGTVPGVVPPGWVALWVLTTFGGIPLGVLLLVGKGWRGMPMIQRRGTAMGFLLVGLINSFSLILGILYGHGDAGPLFCLPAAYGVALLLVYTRVFGDGQAHEELFP